MNIMNLMSWNQMVDGKNYLVMWAPVGEYNQFQTEEHREWFVKGMTYRGEYIGEEYVIRGNCIVHTTTGNGYMVPMEDWPTEPPPWVIGNSYEDDIQVIEEEDVPKGYCHHCL